MWGVYNICHFAEIALLSQAFFPDAVRNVKRRGPAEIREGLCSLSQKVRNANETILT